MIFLHWFRDLVRSARICGEAAQAENEDNQPSLTAGWRQARLVLRQLDMSMVSLQPRCMRLGMKTSTDLLSKRHKPERSTASLRAPKI